MIPISCPRTSALASVLCVLALSATPVRAQSLHDFVEAAVSRSPELVAVSGRRDNADARRSAAAAPTPGAPTLSGSYATDQLVRNRQQREAQIGISTPLWLPGESTASRRVAEAELSRSATQDAAIRLKLAGQVRDSLAEVALAQGDLAVAERRLRDATALEADIARRVRAREASEADALLAQAERVSAKADLRDRRTALAHARLDFESLTGRPPALFALDEPLGDPTQAGHPALGDARSAADVAAANQALTAIQVRENPELGLFARRSRDMFATNWNTSLGVELRVPLASQARNQPRQIAAQAEVTEAAAALASTERELRTHQQKARISYDNAIVQRDLARERARALAKQSTLVARAFQAGQAPLVDTIRARAQAFEAEAASARADIGIARARGRLNQALGVIP